MGVSGILLGAVSWVMTLSSLARRFCPCTPVYTCGVPGKPLLDIVGDTPDADTVRHAVGVVT